MKEFSLEVSTEDSGKAIIWEKGLVNGVVNTDQVRQSEKSIWVKG